MVKHEEMVFDGFAKIRVIREPSGGVRVLATAEGSTTSAFAQALERVFDLLCNADKTSLDAFAKLMSGERQHAATRDERSSNGHGEADGRRQE